MSPVALAQRPDALGRLFDPAQDREWLSVALVVATCAHLLLGLPLARLSATRRPHAITVPTEVFDIELAKLPPHRAEEEPETAHAPAPEHPAAVPAPPPRERAQAMRPASADAARAGAVVTRQAKPDEPLDFGDFVSGNADTYAGGPTRPDGTSPRPIHGPLGPPPVPAASSHPAARAPDPPPRGPDRSRPAGLEGRSQWRCPFPPEADEAPPMDHVVVTLEVNVDATGRLAKVTIVRDAGRGFGREAARCATGRRWTSALDRDGSPITATLTLNVRFDR
jgi:protein TonB